MRTPFESRPIGLFSSYICDRGKGLDAHQVVGAHQVTRVGAATVTGGVLLLGFGTTVPLLVAGGLLQGSVWKPERMADIAVPDDSSAYIQFRSKRRLVGFTLFGWTADYLMILWRSGMVAAVTTLICVTLSYPLCFFIAGRPRRSRYLWLTLPVLAVEK